MTRLRQQQFADEERGTGMPIDPADTPLPPTASPAELGCGTPSRAALQGKSIKAVTSLLAGLVVAATAFLAGTGVASASTGPLHARWLIAARVTTHTSEYQRFCVQHHGNDHYWREGFCHGDLQKYPDYGKLSAPPGYHVCYVRDSVRAGSAARIALSHGVHPKRHVRGC